MTAIEVMSLLLETTSIILFCGFMSIFILPNLFIWIFYTIPQSLRFFVGGKISIKSILPTITKIMSWSAIILLLYAIAFVSGRDIFASLLYKPIALANWGGALIYILVSIVSTSRRRAIQDEFYEEIYLKFIKPGPKEIYDKYIQTIKTFTLDRTQFELRRKLTYLQNKAVMNRIVFLENNPEEQKRIETEHRSEPEEEKIKQKG